MIHELAIAAHLLGVPADIGREVGYTGLTHSIEHNRDRQPGKRHRGGPRTRWSDYISHLIWELLRIPQEELGNVAGERDVSLP